MPGGSAAIIAVCARKSWVRANWLAWRRGRRRRAEQAGDPRVGEQHRHAGPDAADGPGEGILPGATQDGSSSLLSTTVLMPPSLARLVSTPASAQAVGRPCCLKHRSVPGASAVFPERVRQYLAGHRVTDAGRRPAMLRSRPEWLSAATSTLAYGVRKAGAPAVDVSSCDSHFAAAVLGCSREPLRADGVAVREVGSRHHGHVGQQRGVDVPGQLVFLGPGGARVEQGGEAAAGSDGAGQLGRRERLRARALLRRVDERPHPRHLQPLGLGSGGCRPARTAGTCGRPPCTWCPRPRPAPRWGRRRTGRRSPRPGTTRSSARSRRSGPRRSPGPAAPACWSGRAEVPVAGRR